MSGMAMGMLPPLVREADGNPNDIFPEIETCLGTGIL